jgi:flagellum-specific peptidoglycan hydrolase FlgJ
MTKAEFLAAATRAALASSCSSGLPPGVTVAQAALESAWGQSQLSLRANNYFGIKAHGQREFVELPTTEVIHGQAVRAVARFARYESIDACFADRDAIILKLPCYAEARACAADPPAFMRALARHWATDPHYAGKLVEVYTQNGLDALDCKHGAAASAVRPAGTPGPHE